MFDNVIFDMDGVLIESEVFYCKRRFEFLDQKNITPSSLTIQDYIGLTDEDTWKKLLSNDNDQRRYLKEEYSLYKKKYPIDYKKAMRKDVPFILDALVSKGKKIGLASSSPRVEIEEMITQCNLSSFFNFVISGEEVVRSKPDPAIYLKASHALKGTSLAVEDSPVGIEAAKQANLFTVALEQGYEIDQSKADKKISSLTELLQFFK